MQDSNWKRWLEGLGAVAVAASLIFVGMQIRQDREIALVDGIGTRAQTIAGLAELVGENRDLWVRGLDGEELSVEDRAMFLSMIEAVESYYVYTYRRYAHIGPREPEEALQQYAYALYVHPGLRAAWDNQLQYIDQRDATLGTTGIGREFRDGVDAVLTELDAAGSGVPDIKRYVFW